MISAFSLKIIAMFTMALDHLGYILYSGKLSCFNYIGRLSFPIFAFQISEGYTHTKNLKKYFFRLILFAIISQIPYMLFHSIMSKSFSLNIFFTLLLGLLSILIYDKSKNKFIGIISALFLSIVAKISKCDYGFYGVVIILLFYIFKNKKLYMSLSFIFATLIKYLIPVLKYGYNVSYVMLFIFTVISIVPLLLYNSKKGKNIKYLLYLFYPIHLLIFYFIYTFGIK